MQDALQDRYRVLYLIYFLLQDVFLSEGKIGASLFLRYFLKSLFLYFYFFFRNT